MLSSESTDDVRDSFFDFRIFEFMLLAEPMRLAAFFLPVSSQHTDPVGFDVMLGADVVQAPGQISQSCIIFDVLKAR